MPQLQDEFRENFCQFYIAPFCNRDAANAFFWAERGIDAEPGAATPAESRYAAYKGQLLLQMPEVIARIAEISELLMPTESELDANLALLAKSAKSESIRLRALMQLKAKYKKSEPKKKKNSPKPSAKTAKPVPPLPADPFELTEEEKNAYHHQHQIAEAMYYDQLEE